MLRQLEIQNIALIDKVNIEFDGELNVLTGETGAGKSIIIDSINAILGGRVSRDLIRTGQDKAFVQAVFNVDLDKVLTVLDKYGIESEEDNTLIISRRFGANGKNTCRVNGNLVTVSVLRNIGEYLIDIHGQHDNQSLLRTERHIELLDLFGGQEIETIKIEYQNLLSRYKNTKDKLKELSGDDKERERKIDLLKFQIDEIEKANLKVEEENELEKQKLTLANSEKIIESFQKAYTLLYSSDNLKDSALDSINETIATLDNISDVDQTAKQVYKRLEDVTYQLEDISHIVREQRDSVEYNPNALEEIEERLDLIHNLKRKYGDSIEDILKYCEQAEESLEQIIKSEEIVVELKRELENLDSDLYRVCKKLNAERTKAANILEKRITLELNELEMENARFKANVEFDNVNNKDDSKNYTQNGLDRVQFMISPNVGEALKPLAKIASGGEMSRVMLAIKTILANIDEIPTLIFDEVDTGVSGKAAQKVGEKLQVVSNNHQVICITHLPQIACMADSHFSIEKISKADSTYTFVEKLSKSEAKDELARIIGGANITDNTIKLAQEMINNAQKRKAQQTVKTH